MQTEKRGNRIAVLIPCYNEALTIGNVVRDYRQALPDADIYVYDNNSTDETARLAREAGAIVRPEPRQGKGNVVRTMFRDIEADCYLMVDGDDTYPASQAAALCAPVLEGRADMVIGDRLSSTYFTENKRPFHNCGNMLVRRCINMFWKRGRQIEDVMTGMRAMSPLFVKSFPILSQGFEIETEMTIFSLANNFRIASMPIQYRFCMLAALLSFVAGLTLDCQRKRARQAFEIQLNVLSLLLRQGRTGMPSGGNRPEQDPQA